MKKISGIVLIIFSIPIVLILSICLLFNSKEDEEDTDTDVSGNSLAIYKSAQKLAYEDGRKVMTPKKEYKLAHDKYFPTDSLYASCDRFVATVIKDANADKNIPIGPTAVQYNYLKSQTKKYKNIKYTKGNIQKTVKKGDIAVTTGDGHILIEGIQQKNNYEEFQASYLSYSGTRTAMSKSYNLEVDLRTFAVYRKIDTSNTTGGYHASVKDSQKYAKKKLNNTKQYKCLKKLWQKESSWNWNALNPSSGAYGIPQALPAEKMAKSPGGKDYKDNAFTQINWGLGYIKDRYSTSCKAYQHSQNKGWY